MNETTINLLPNSAVKSGPHKKVLVYVRLIAGVAFAFLLISSISVFFINQLVAGGRIKNEEQKALADFSRLNDRMAKLLFTHDRLLEIDSVLKKRPNFEAEIQKAQSLLPPNMSIDSITVGEETVEITISSPSLLSVNDFLDRISDSFSQGVFKSVIIQGVGFDGKGSYFVSARMHLL